MFSFGSDPEFMLIDKNNRFVSAINVIGNSKTNKLDIGNGHSLFYDNVLLEMNITPGWDIDEVIELFRDAFCRANGVIYPHKKHIISSAKYPADQCEHKEAKRFGCEPEFCAYEIAVITPPDCNDTFRSAGGHIHLGDEAGSYPLMIPPGKNDNSEMDWGRIWVVRMLDLFLGIPSVILDSSEPSVKRRLLYGKAGAHRPKDYGVEYRVLSNFWLSSPKMVRLIHKLCAHSIGFVKANEHKRLWKGDWCSPDNKSVGYDSTELCRIINESDKKAAIKFMEKTVRELLPNKLWVDIFEMSETNNAKNFYTDWKISDRRLEKK